MKWSTRENVKVDRVACPWLIKRFVDPQAEFLSTNQVMDCGACGYATCAEFLQARPKYQTPASEDWEFAGPVCQLRAIDLGIAVGSAAKTASLHNIDARCQTRIAAAARHLGLIKADLAVALSISVSHKNIFFDKKMPEVKFDAPAA